jgi:hypothetical protein
MKRNSRNPEKLQPGLFDRDEPDVVLLPTQKARLSTLVEALFIEIAAALATGEAGDEQDHR